jgi:hypothetical protein
MYNFDLNINNLVGVGMNPRAFPADKEFVFVVDFTWNNDRLAILEMGDYYRSCISGLDHLRKMEGKGPFDEEIKASTKTKYPDAICLYDKSTEWSCAIDLHDFHRGMSSSYNMKNLYPIKRLLEARAALPDTIQPLRGMVAALGLRLGLEIHEAIHLESILEASQHFCLLNYPSGGLYYSCINKVAFHLFNHGSNIVPATCLVDLCDFDKNRVNEFLEKFRDKQFVIKPTDQSQGRGVVVKTREEILGFLSRLNDYRCRRIRTGTGMRNDYWYDATDRFLLLQTCCPSKKLQSSYHPTGRLVMRAKYSDKNVLSKIEYLGGYWKLPAGISEEPSTRSIVSDVKDDDEPNVAGMDQEDWTAITQAMDENFSPILTKMFCTSAFEMAQQFAQHTDPVMQRYGKHQYQALINSNVAETPSIENKLSKLSAAGIACFEELDYGSPGSMGNRNHFVSAALGLMNVVQHFSPVRLKTAIYQQLRMECKLSVREQATTADIVTQSSVIEESALQQPPSTGNMHRLFNSEPAQHNDSDVVKPKSWVMCNIL